MPRITPWILSCALCAACDDGSAAEPAPEAPAAEPAPEAPAAEAPAAEAPAPEAPAAEPEALPPEAAAALQQAQAAAKQLGGTLKARLQAAMKEGGPEAAMQVCASKAQELTAAAQEPSVQVGRSSLRLRNPKNAGPDWVRDWLKQTGERPLEGLEPVVEITETHARFLKPIGVEGVCVTCHGPKDAIPPQVASLLAEHYPEDQAVGYAPGDLRGVIWAEAALP
jgi:hypothetical protein